MVLEHHLRLLGLQWGSSPPRELRNFLKGSGRTWSLDPIFLAPPALWAVVCCQHDVHSTHPGGLGVSGNSQALQEAPVTSQTPVWPSGGEGEAPVARAQPGPLLYPRPPQATEPCTCSAWAAPCDR